MFDRRTFLKNGAVASGAILSGGVLAGAGRVVRADQSQSIKVGCNQYTLGSFYAREQKNFMDHLDEIRDAGVNSVEVTAGDPAVLKEMGQKLAEHGLGMESIFVGGNLHDESTVRAACQNILAAAAAAKPFGTRIIVINTDPKANKSDAELRLQTRALNRVGAELRKEGFCFAYHYHTTELENGAREFIHCMNGTDPENLTLCFDTHWTYRASGNSEVAVFDAAKMYRNRIGEFHFRQSKDHIWTEFFEPQADIDYVKLAEYFKQTGEIPFAVLEQAPEGGTPNTTTTGEILKKSCETVRALFG